MWNWISSNPSSHQRAGAYRDAGCLDRLLAGVRQQLSAAGEIERLGERAATDEVQWEAHHHRSNHVRQKPARLDARVSGSDPP